MVALGQGLPETVGHSRIAPALHPGYDASTGPFHGQPKLELTSPRAHKYPYFIEFERLQPLTLRFYRSSTRKRRTGQLRFGIASLATVMQATPVTRTILRCELRSASCFSTWAQRSPAQLLQAQSGPGARRLCIGGGRARHCDRFGRSAAAFGAGVLSAYHKLNTQFILH